MTRPRLIDTLPQWEPPEDDPNAPVEEWREVQYGVLRIVHNRKRVRLLKRRGVVMWQIAGVWCWFVDHPRLIAKKRRAIEESDCEHV